MYQNMYKNHNFSVCGWNFCILRLKEKTSYKKEITKYQEPKFF